MKRTVRCATGVPWCYQNRRKDILLTAVSTNTRSEQGSASEFCLELRVRKERIACVLHSCVTLRDLV
ncbi:hypothetical protein NDU88_002271 [Pleurodeles waltl]|uniref:Uncharacterized protein n=1 Tax=Pleurodeles waltl TaxID=8319 RepID=A0AAV7P9H8_PLEWA|nr:hypothetical protein NDU88_002271 [Pleurodeles waltl]